jgi:hypothetical protein
MAFKNDVADDVAFKNDVADDMAPVRPPRASHLATPSGHPSGTPSGPRQVSRLAPRPAPIWHPCPAPPFRAVDLVGLQFLSCWIDARLGPRPSRCPSPI